ncbi:hypothetical protein ACQ7B2_30300, partial [Escherichia coli]
PGLQLDFTNLNDRLGVRVVRDVANDSLAMRAEASLEIFHGIKEKVPMAIYEADEPGCTPDIPCSTDI